MKLFTDVKLAMVVEDGKEPVLLAEVFDTKGVLVDRRVVESKSTQSADPDPAVPEKDDGDSTDKVTPPLPHQDTTENGAGGSTHKESPTEGGAPTPEKGSETT